MKKLVCSKKRYGLTFSKFYGLEYLQDYYGIRTTCVIQKLAHIKAKCSNLRKHFNFKEIKQLNILIYLLISKNQTPLNQIVKAYRGRSLKRILKKKNIKTTKQSSTPKSNKQKYFETNGTKIQVYKNVIKKIKRNVGISSFKGLQMYEE
jgi:hypothetical protein